MNPTWLNPTWPTAPRLHPPLLRSQTAFIDYATITGSTYQDLTTTTWIAGVFTAGSMADLDSVKLLLYTASPPAQVSVSIHEYNATSQGTGTQLGVTAAYTFSVSASDTYVTITPSTPWRLPTAGANYVRCAREGACIQLGRCTCPGARAGCVPHAQDLPRS